MEPRFDEKRSLKTSEEETIPDLSADDIGKIKRRITDVLHRGETVILIVYFQHLSGQTELVGSFFMYDVVYFVFVLFLYIILHIYEIET